MKKVITFVIAFVLILVLAAPVCADFDLSGLSFDELVALREQIDLAIWNSEEWQEVTVPQGVWEIGADIPEGKWTIRAAPNAMSMCWVGTELQKNGNEVKSITSAVLISPTNFVYQEGSSRTEWTVELVAGEYIQIATGSAVFSPYAGKPALGFK